MKKHLFIIALSMSVTLASYADSNIRHGDVLYTSTDMKTCTVDGVITGTYGKVVIPESFDFTPILDPSHTYHLTVVGVSADGFSDGGNATIEEVVLPESVTQIGPGAFKNCTALKSINIPSKVTELERSFNYCKSLRRITIPATVLSVEGSFAYCDTIEELIIADGGTSLYLNTNQVGVFSNTSIKKIYQGRNITSTNNGGFNFTEKGIADLIIGDMVTEIGNKAYYGNPIENISFGKGLAKIGNSAFQYCDRLTSIELPESLAELGLYAFNNCAMLSHIKIGSKLAELENNFNYCKSIQTVTIPATIQTVAGSFAYCDTIEELVIADDSTPLYLNTSGVSVFSNTYIKKIYQGRNITSTNNGGFNFTEKGIADLVVGDMVTEIGKEAYYDNPIENISFGKGLAKIGNSAFQYCDRLTSIELPESLAELGLYAFNNCAMLSHIKIGSKLAELENNFNYCKSIQTVTIPATIQTVAGSFAYCDTIEELVIADGGTSLYLNTNQVGVFSNTSIKKIYQGRNITSTNNGGFKFTEKGIADLVVGDMVTEIGKEAYYDNPIENISFGKGLAKIGNSAFQYCDRLTSIELPESLAELGLYAFNNCAMLSHIKIGSKLAELENNFNYCKSIQTVTIPATIQTVAGSFAYCDTIEELVIADDSTPLYLNTSGVSVFSNTYIKKIYQGRNITSTNNSGFKFTKKGIADLVVGDMVTEIGKEAYNDNPIENISFGNSLAKIGDSAFQACNNIKTITTYAVAVPECASSSVFTQNTYDSTWLLVPTGSRKLYSEALVWKLFKNVGQSTCAVTFEYDNKQCNVIVPESFEGIVDFGTSITFSATPNDGFKISSITADGEYGSLKADADGVWKLDSIRSDVTVKISSGELTYSVSAKIDPEAGRITINNEDVDSTIITWNQNVTIGILLNEGYRIEAADANGVDVTDKITDNHLSIESIRENVTVVFTTALKSFRFKSEYDNAHGTVSVNGNTSDEQIFSYGNRAKIEIIPDEGYCVAWAYLNGRDILKELKDNQYITDPIKENTTLNIGFETRVILLSVLGIEGGRVANIYDYGMSARVRVIPDENWHINSVVFNGSPIAFDEVSESIFTTPALTDDSEISVTFEKNDISSLSNNAIADIKVYGYNHTVMILNAPEDEPAYITDTNGRTIYSGIEREITVNDSGIYLVTIGTRTFKLML